MQEGYCLTRNPPVFVGKAEMMRHQFNQKTSRCVTPPVELNTTLMRKTLSLLSMLMLYSILTFAQQKTVTGKVVDPQGQPVPFATVRIKGARGGVSADADGNFSIKATSTETLVVTGAGIVLKEAPVGEGTALVIQVTRQSSNLDEVVVTALG